MSSILIVDEDRLSCDLLKTALTRHHYKALPATTATQAIALFRRHRPRLTLVKLTRPHTNGLRVLRRIRDIDAEAKVVLLTGPGGNGFARKARQLKIDKILGRDVTLKDLERTVVRLMGRSRRTAGSKTLPHPRSAAAPQRELILVVDDDPAILQLLKRWLSLRGYRVQTANNGIKALDFVKQQPPNLILLDINMPGMNGVEVLRLLRERGYSGGVIGLTGSQDEKVLQSMLDMGSMDVLGKPVKRDWLGLVVHLALTVATPDPMPAEASPMG